MSLRTGRWSSIVSRVEKRTVRGKVFEIVKERDGYLVRMVGGPWVRVKTKDDVEEEIRFWSTRRGPL